MGTRKELTSFFSVTFPAVYPVPEPSPTSPKGRKDVNLHSRIYQLEMTMTHGAIKIEISGKGQHEV